MYYKNVIRLFRFQFYELILLLDKYIFQLFNYL
jgi:hypothetical protein